MAREWNVNIHYDARQAACVPARAAAVPDVGCDDGFLTPAWPARSRRRSPSTSMPRCSTGALIPDAIGFSVIGVVIRVRGKWNHTAQIVWPPRDAVIALLLDLAEQAGEAAVALAAVLVQIRLEQVERPGRSLERRMRWSTACGSGGG